MLVLTDDMVQQHSTDAARRYVLVTRERMRAELARDGIEVTRRRSYRRLEQTITPSALAQVWPHADIEAALAD